MKDGRPTFTGPSHKEAAKYPPVHPTFLALTTILPQLTAMEMPSSSPLTSSVCINRRLPQHSFMTLLPLELLICIFECIFYLTEPDERSRVPYLLGCVCSHWRAAVHSTPLIWSSIDFKSMELIKSHLLQAKSYPIDLRIRHFGLVRHMSPILREAVYQYGSVIQGLRLEFPDNSDGRALLQDLPTGLPKLRRLRLSVAPKMHDAPFLELSTRLSTDLEHVSLSHLFFRSLPGPTNIRVLRIQSSCPEPTFSECLTIDTLMEILAMCPQLEELLLWEIDCLFPYYDSLEGYPAQPVKDALRLRNLKSLTLNLDAPLVALFLAHTIIPAEAQVYCVSDFDSPDDDFEAMFPQPVPHREQGLMVAPELRSAVLTPLRSVSSLRIDYFKEIPTARGEEVDQPDPSVTVEFSWCSVSDMDPADVKKAYDTLMSLPSAIPAAQLTDVHILLGEETLTNREWRSVFSGFTGVTTLCLGGPIRNDDGWLHGLGAKSLSSDDLVLPNLRELRLQGATIDIGFSRLLKKVLVKRSKKLQRPLHLLSIRVQDSETDRRGPSDLWPGPAIKPAEVEHFSYGSMNAFNPHPCFGHSIPMTDFCGEDEDGDEEGAGEYAN